MGKRLTVWGTTFAKIGDEAQIAANTSGGW